MNTRISIAPLCALIAMAAVGNARSVSAAPADQSPADALIASTKLFDLTEPEVLERIGMEPVDVIVIGSEQNEGRELRFRFPFGDLMVAIGQSGVVACGWEMFVEKEQVDDLAKVWAGLADKLRELNCQILNHGLAINDTVIEGTYSSVLEDAVGLEKRWRKRGEFVLEMRFVVELSNAAYAKPYLFINISQDPYY